MSLIDKLRAVIADYAIDNNCGEIDLAVAISNVENELEIRDLTIDLILEDYMTRMSLDHTKSNYQNFIEIRENYRNQARVRQTDLICERLKHAQDKTG